MFRLTNRLQTMCSALRFGMRDAQNQSDLRFFVVDFGSWKPRDKALNATFAAVTQRNSL